MRLLPLWAKDDSINIKRLISEPEIGEGHGSLKAFLCRETEIVPITPTHLNQQAQALWGSIRLYLARRTAPELRGDTGGASAKLILSCRTRKRLWGATAKTQYRGRTPALGLDDLIGLGAVEAVHVERPL